MKWEPITPKSGDMIRVKHSFYYHYGIYIDESTVVQFGLAADASGAKSADEIFVLSSDIATFAGGGEVECAVLTMAERAIRRPPEATCAFALSRIGEGGYNIIHNNCEHFANLCVFNKSVAPGIDSVRSAVRQRLNKS